MTIIGAVMARLGCRNERQELVGMEVEPTRAKQGCINYDFPVDAGDPYVFAFYENWTSHADLDAHLKRRISPPHVPD